MMAEVQRECTNSHQCDEDHFTRIVGYEASRLEDKKPHAEAKSAQECRKSLCNIFEQQ